MKLDVATEVARLEAMSVNQLANRYRELFGDECRSRHKRYLLRRIAWRMQAVAEGDLSERARRRADELAHDAEIRVTPPRTQKPDGVDEQQATVKVRVSADERLPPPGSWIEREYKGKVVRVLVIKDGFEYEDKRYRSLSAVAKEITGTHINGFLFFKLRGQK